MGASVVMEVVQLAWGRGLRDMVRLVHHTSSETYIYFPLITHKQRSLYTSCAFILISSEYKLINYITIKSNVIKEGVRSKYQWVFFNLK